MIKKPNDDVQWVIGRMVCGIVVYERDQAFDHNLDLEAECIGESTDDVHNVPSSGAEI